MPPIDPMARPNRRPSSSRRPAPSRRSPGFTLIELLVGTLLGSLVLGAIGGALITSEVRVAQQIRRDTGRREGINRVVALMQNEANTSSGLDSLAAGINTTTRATDICVLNGPSLRVRASGGAVVCYKAVPSSSSLGTSYSATSGTSSESPWAGSCRLIREGPPYDANGDMYLNSASFRQVMLDDLRLTNGSCIGAFTYTLTAPATSSTLNALSGAATVTITQSNGVATTFSLRTGSNPASYGMERCNQYYDNTVYSATTSPDGNPSCANDTTRHRRLQFPNSTAQPAFPDNTTNQSKINFYYLPYARSNYSLSSCSYASCIISSNGASITITAVNALIFADGEIRP
jgi:hypothetical protein